MLSRRFLILTFILVMGANLVWVVATDIRYGGDTPRYTQGAEWLLQGTPLPSDSYRYIGYIAFVALSKLTGTHEVGVIVGHCLLYWLAALALFVLTNHVAGKQSALPGILSFVLFATNWDLFRWNAYILTESVFISVQILTLTSFFLGYRKKRLWLGTAIGCLWLASIRPQGIVLGGVILGWLVFRLHSRAIRVALALAAIAFVLIVPAYIPALNEALYVNISKAVVNGTVVFNYPSWDLTMPPPVAPLQFNVPGTSEMVTLGLYVLQNPIEFMLLVIARLAALLGHVRPFYSMVHNGVALAYLIPIYILTLLGIWTHRKQQEIRFLTIFILAHFAFVGLTYADWDGRFLLYPFPFLYVPAVLGVWESARLLFFRAGQEPIGC